MSESRPPEPSSASKRLSLDERIALLVAFLGFGTIGIWAIVPHSQSIPWLQTLSEPSNQRSPVSSSPSPAPNTSSSSPSVSEKAAITLPTETPSQHSPIATTVTPPRSAPIDLALSEAPPSSPAPPVQPSQSAPSPPSTTVPPTPTTSPPPTSAPIAFPDVPANFWASRYINELSRRGILTGFPDGRFQPNQPITRAEFARLITLTLNPTQPQSTPKSKVTFKDLKANYWATSAIEQVTQAGFMAGYPGQVFRPDQPIPRVQMWVAIATGLKLPPPPQAAKALATYRDAKDIPPWAMPQMGTAANAGLIVTPTLNQLSPNQPATRADAAAYLYQALVKANKIKP